MAATGNTGPTGAAALNQAAQGAANLTTGLAAAAKVGGTLFKTIVKFAAPLNIAAGFALAFVAKLTLGIGKSETLQRGLEKIARIQYYTPQFQKLLGGLDQAKKRLAEIDHFATRGVFSFDDAAEGNKRLETLTRGVLSTKEGMNAVGNAAAVSGVKFAEMAGIIGALQSDLANDRPIAGTVDGLVAMGAVTAATGDKMKLMKDSGFSTVEMLAALTQALKQNNGGMDAAAKTIGGLEAALQEAGTANDKAFAEPFDEGKRAGLEAALKLTTALKPAFEALGNVLSIAFNAIANVSNAFAGWIVAIPGLGAAIGGLCTMLGTLISLAALFALASTTQMIASMVALAYAFYTTATATTVFGFAIVTLRIAIQTLIGPIGWIIAGISLLAGLFGLLGADSGKLGDKQDELKGKVKSATEAIKEQIEAIQTQSEKNKAVMDTVKTTNSANADADVIEKRNKDRVSHNSGGWGLGDNVQDSIGWWRNKFGGDQELADAKKTAKDRGHDERTAWEAKTNPELAARMGDDYVAVAADSQKKMDVLQQRLKEARNSGGSKEDKKMRMDAVTHDIAAEQARDMKTEAERNFNRKQVAGESQVSAMREVGRRTGNVGMLDAADARESTLFKSKRLKELQTTTSLKGDADHGDIKAVLDSDTMMHNIDMLKKRGGTPAQSSLAAIGGAGGFGGVVNNIPQKMLDQLKVLTDIVNQIKDDQGTDDHDSKFNNNANTGSAEGT